MFKQKTQAYYYVNDQGADQGRSQVVTCGCDCTRIIQETPLIVY